MGRLNVAGGIDHYRREEMCVLSARKKLNAIYAGSSVAVAAIIGALAGSWVVFAVAVAVLIACSLAGDDIRPNKRRR